MAGPQVTGVLADPSLLIASIRRAVAPITEAAARKVMTEAEAGWPVKTGTSKAGLVVEDRSTPTVVRWVVGNTVDYSRYIRSTRVGTKLDSVRNRAVFTELLQKPTRAAQRKLGPDIVAAAVEVVNGR